jgi:ATP-dependent Clp protease ATP-binding subunit ClpC
LNEVLSERELLRPGRSARRRSRNAWVGALDVSALGGFVGIALQETPLGTAVAVEGNPPAAVEGDRFAPARRIRLRRLQGGWLLQDEDAPSIHDWGVVGVLDLDLESARSTLERSAAARFGSLPWVKWSAIFAELSAPARRALRGFPLPHVDLTARAATGRCEVPVGTERFLTAWNRMQQALLRTECRGVMLTGVAGVGKSSLLRFAAQALVHGEVASRLQGLSLVALDASIFDPQRSNLNEPSLYDALSKLARAPLIVVVDEAHRLARSASSSGATELLKLLISEHDLRVVLCSNESHRLFGRDPALERRTTVVPLPQASPRELRDFILPAKADWAARTRGVQVEEAGLDAVVGYSTLEGRHAQPHAAVALLDRCVARAECDGLTELDADRIRYLALEELGATAGDIQTLLTRVRYDLVGHEEALRGMLQLLLAVERRQLNPRARGVEQPFAVVVVGPPGVGKSTFAAALHRLRCGAEAGAPFVVRGADFARSEAVNRLVGAPPAYIGHGGSAEIAKAIQANPRTVIEFAEPELGSRELLDRVLMPILDGRLVTNEGDVLITRGVCVVITTNAGTAGRRSIGFSGAGSTATEGEAQAVEALKRLFPAPLWSRLGGRAVWLGPLPREDLKTVAERLLSDLADREGVTVISDEATTDCLVDHSTEVDELGVRALQRTFHELVEEPVEQHLLRRPELKGFRVTVPGEDALTVVPLERVTT